MNTADNRIRELRRAARLTQEEVATLLGVGVAVVHRHETGSRGVGHKNIKKYAAIVKCWTYEIFVKAAGPREEWREGNPLPVEEESGFAD